MTDRTPLPLALDDEVVARAVHGSYCPKMCNHTCPVLRATGRNDAVPWGFHRTVADLADGRLTPVEAAGRLVACSGCGACAEGCAVEGQDVPAQVRAGRTAVHAAGAAAEAVHAAVTAVAAGTSPYGVVDPPMAMAAALPTMTLWVGCRDDATVVASAVQLLGAAGEAVSVALPEGCCGGVLRDLGAADAADAARATTATGLGRSRRVVLLDPHCRGEVEAAVPEGVAVDDLLSVLRELVHDGRLVLRGAPEAVRWHEPCLLVDGPAAGAGAAVLAAAGALVELPGEAHRGCTGGGMGMDLLAPDAAAEVAAARRAELAGPGPLVTGCAGAVARLADGGGEVRHVVTLLADLLDDDPEAVA